MTFRAKWTIGMTAFGLLVAVVVLLLTDSVGWAVVGLLGAGVVANSLVHPGRGG